MNKMPIFLILLLLASFYFGKAAAYASENENELELNNSLKIESNLEKIQISGEGKNKTQFRIKNNYSEYEEEDDEDEDLEFTLKGVITASSSTNLVIDKKTIFIDPAITKEIKIVGDIKIGAYAIIKGIIKDSNYYAEKIIINERNKKDIEEDDENATLSATFKTNQNASLDKSMKGGIKENFNMKFLLKNIQDILNSFRSILQSI